METAKGVFDFVFHWAGVWAVMVYGTVGAREAYYAFRHWMNAREKKRLFDEAIRNLNASVESRERDGNGSEA